MTVQSKTIKDHYARARECLDKASQTEQSSDSQALWLAEAQVWATLRLGDAMYDVYDAINEQ